MAHTESTRRRPADNEARTSATIGDRLAHAEARLANAIAIGRPAHIARCKQRRDGILARATNHTDGGE